MNQYVYPSQDYERPCTEGLGGVYGHPSGDEAKDPPPKRCSVCRAFMRIANRQQRAKREECDPCERGIRFGRIRKCPGGCGSWLRFRSAEEPDRTCESCLQKALTAAAVAAMATETAIPVVVPF